MACLFRACLCFFWAAWWLLRWFWWPKFVWQLWLTGCETWSFALCSPRMLSFRSSSHRLITVFLKHTYVEKVWILMDIFTIQETGFEYISVRYSKLVKYIYCIVKIFILSYLSYIYQHEYDSYTHNCKCTYIMCNFHFDFVNRLHINIYHHLMF